MDKKKDKRVKQRDAIGRDDYYMALAAVAAAISRNPGDQNGALLLSSNNKDWAVGADAMPGPLAEVAPWDEEFVIPAEMRAIQGVNPVAGTLYTTRCPSIAVISYAIERGVKRIIYMPTTKPNDKTMELVRLAYIQLEEYRGDINWLRDYVKSMEGRGLFG